MRSACATYRNDVIYGRDMSKLFSWTVTSIGSDWILTMKRILLRGIVTGGAISKYYTEVDFDETIRCPILTIVSFIFVHLQFIRNWRNMQKIFVS